ncbi:MAG: transposase, partial [Pseudohongiellaceae bacterium]
LSQALLDETALVACMVYVDLNPIRAKLCKTLEESEFTSIQERLKEFGKKAKQAEQNWLQPMATENVIDDGKSVLPIRQTDYFALVDWTGRAVRSDKRGAIPATVQPILQKLGAKQDRWVQNTQYFGNRFGRVLGPIAQIKALASTVNQKWLVGVGQARALYR